MTINKSVRKNLHRTLFAIPTIFLIATIVQYAVAVTQFNQDYKIGFQNVFVIQPRVSPIRVIKTAQGAELSLTDYICLVFGKDCKTALAIAQAENGTHQCDRVHINSDHSIDIGVFQINSVHLKKDWRLADLVDCKGNVDLAYQLYQEQGWTPWVTYKTGAYKQYLK